MGSPGIPRYPTLSMAIDPAELQAAVASALAGGESVGVAYERAMLALRPRERKALTLLHSGMASSRTQAIQGAGYKNAAKVVSEVFARLPVALAHRLHELLSEPGREVTKESYRDDLVSLAHADPVDAFDDQGKLRPLSEWPKPLRRMVKSIKLGPFGNIEDVVFEGRATLLGLLGKHKMVGAFDQAKVERRVYVLRDFTGQTKPYQADQAGASPSLPASSPVTLEGQLVSSLPSTLDQARDDQTDMIGAIDRGRIPLRR